jgi:hypothetical protein
MVSISVALTSLSAVDPPVQTGSCHVPMHFNGTIWDSSCSPAGRKRKEDSSEVPNKEAAGKKIWEPGMFRRYRQPSRPRQPGLNSTNEYTPLAIFCLNTCFECRLRTPVHDIYSNLPVEIILSVICQCGDSGLFVL